MLCLPPVRTFFTSSRARRARQARQSAGVRPAWRATSALPPVRRSSRRQPAGHTRAAVTRRAPRAALRPSGPRRRRRAPGPRSHSCQLSAATSQRWRAYLQKLPSSRRSSIEPRKITLKGARYARVATRRPLTVISTARSAPIGRMATTIRMEPRGLGLRNSFRISTGNDASRYPAPQCS